MCFLLQVINSLKVKCNWRDYLKEKELAKQGKGRASKRTTKNVLPKCKGIEKIVDCYERKLKLLYLKLKTEGTFENHVLMAFVGYILGVLITYNYFYNTLYKGDGSVFWSFVIKLPVLVFLTTQFAFSPAARSYLFMLPIQMFSGKGQVYLKTMMSLLMVEGPMLNLQYNLNVIQESSACQQRGVAAAAAEIADILFGPFSSFKQAATEIVNGIKRIVDKLQNILSAFKRTVMAVASAIQAATKWINSKINGCKNTVGTTYDHCMKGFTWMLDECKVSVPSYLTGMCKVTEFASKLCSSVKPGEYLCDLVYFNVDPLVTTINQRISRLMDRAYTLMYFNVNIHHEYMLDSNSKSISEELKEKLTSVFDSAIVLGVVTFIKDMIMIVFSFLFLFFMFLYRSKYFKRESFDNYYISKRVISIDIEESQKGKESIFPLRRTEKKQYTKVGAYALLNKEIQASYLSYSVIIHSIVNIIIIGLDYLLFYITDKCREFMLAMMQSFGNQTKIEVMGSGFIAELSRRVVRALNYMDYNAYYTHFMPCMPNPKPPNSWTNIKIIVIMALLWVGWITQPYFMRLRHVVMDYYYPDMADRRARWLYKDIRMKRITFINLIRVQLKAKYGGAPKEASVADWLRAKLPWITYIIGKGLLAEDCMICNHVKPPLFHCTNKGCMGIYCDDCYVNIQGYCSLCKNIMTHEEFETCAFRKRKVASDDEGGIDGPEDSFTVNDDLKDQDDLEYEYQSGYAQDWGRVEELDVKKIHAQQWTTVYYYVDGDVNRRNKSGHKYIRLQQSH